MRRALALIPLLACFATPTAAQAAVETGTLGVLHKDGFGHGPTEYDYSLKQGNRTIPVLPTQVGSAGQGDRVRITGQEQDGRLVGKVAATDTAASPPAGQRTLGVILVNWAGDTRQPWTPEEVRQAIFTGGGSMNAFYKEESYDKISFDGDVLGWYTINAPSTGCDSQYGNWQNLGFQAAQADGANVYGYDHVMLVFPSTDCSFAGLAMVGGPYSWINGTLGVSVTAHEMGHNLGLHHANAYSCTSGGSPATISDSCVSMEYGDPFDVMGSGGPHHNSGWHLQKLGVLDPSNVETITESGTYTMHSALTQTTEPTTLRIPRTRGSNGSVIDWYYLETRQAGGVFENDYLSSEPALNGVTIRLNDDPSVVTQSRLLKSNPSGSWWRWDAPFLAGSSFSDGNVDIGVTSAGGGQATVAITVPEVQPDTQAPTVPTALHGTARAHGAQLAWTASSDDTGVASYTVSRDGAEIGSSATPAFTDSSAVPGAHAYVVAAEDAAHNRSGLSAPVTITVPTPPASTSGPHGSAPRPHGSRAKPDRRPPHIGIRQKRGRGGRVSIRIRATDTSGLASVELFIGGKRRKAVRLSSSTSAGTLRYVGRIPRGARSAAARATDRSGNRSTVTFRLPR
jgi:hypothetical protein